MKHGDKRQVSKNATCANLENYFGGQYLFQVNLKSTLLETLCLSPVRFYLSLLTIT